MANCIWGKGVSSPRAEVQIVSSDGKSSITTVATKVESGMLRFHVAGFGYSSPTIKIRMQNETIKTPENKEKATKTISCIKGKIFKKVSGSNPKCPAGYKIKN